MTYTYVTMAVPKAMHGLIKDKLVAAGYDHAIDGDTLDMHGLALVPEYQSPGVCIREPCENPGIQGDSATCPSQSCPGKPKSEWRRVMQYATLHLPRRGWRGWIDNARAWWTGDPLYKQPVTLTMSAMIKTLEPDTPFKMDVFAPQLEEAVDVDR